MATEAPRQSRRARRRAAVPQVRDVVADRHVREQQRLPLGADAGMQRMPERAQELEPSAAAGERPPGSMTAFLRAPGPHRTRSRKGVAIVRHIYPFWKPADEHEAELERFVELWIGNEENDDAAD